MKHTANSNDSASRWAHSKLANASNNLDYNFAKDKIHDVQNHIYQSTGHHIGPVHLAAAAVGGYAGVKAAKFATKGIIKAGVAAKHYLKNRKDNNK